MPGVRLNNCYVLCRRLTISEGVLTPPLRDIHQSSESIGRRWQNIFYSEYMIGSKFDQ